MGIYKSIFNNYKALALVLNSIKKKKTRQRILFLVGLNKLNPKAFSWTKSLTGKCFFKKGIYKNLKFNFYWRQLLFFTLTNFTFKNLPTLRVYSRVFFYLFVSYKCNISCRQSWLFSNVLCNFKLSVFVLKAEVSFLFLFFVKQVWKTFKRNKVYF